MYLFVYKTTHVNGKFYIGRHQTENLNDGYLGSGKWVTSVKDKSSLSREIITEAKSFEELCELEEHHIDLYWEDPLCMNMKKASIGYTSEDASETNSRRVAKGTHHFLTRADGTNLQTDRVKEGTHHFLTREDGGSLSADRVKAGTNPLQTRPDGSSVASDRVNVGTHHFLTRADGTNLQTDRVKEGTHNFLTRPDGTSLQKDRVADGTHQFLTRPDGTSVGSNINLKRVVEGTHQFLTRPDGTSLTSDRVANETHNFLQNKGLVPCYNKQGEYKRILAEEFRSQSGPKEDWEWVHIVSKEGKRRKLPKEN